MQAFSVINQEKKNCLLALSCDCKKTFPGQTEFCDFMFVQLSIIKRNLPKATSKGES